MDKTSWYSFYLFLPTLMTILMQRSLYSMNQRSSTKSNVFLQETTASWVRLSVCYIGERTSLGNNVTAHLSMSRLAYLFLFLFLGFIEVDFRVSLTFIWFVVSWYSVLHMIIWRLNLFAYKIPHFSVCLFLFMAGWNWTLSAVARLRNNAFQQIKIVINI